ncbi:hypothetical protein H5410_027798 [Solanum commersonii]|uniref:Uncharacterized protein n=1 Tax=Solanum commersonii TaxID=4109 RepID=A0A9J5Z0V3_SOLCO|nr:hypothetical protein H5410_027798 [Solanum commersonii]
MNLIPPRTIDSNLVFVDRSETFDFTSLSEKRLANDSPFGFSHRHMMYELSVQLKIKIESLLNLRLFSYGSMCHSQTQVSGSGLSNISGCSGVDKASASKPGVTIDDTFSYLNQVKEKIPNPREKYNTFLVVIMDFKRVGVRKGVESSLVVEVKEKQDNDPILLELKAKINP